MLGFVEVFFKKNSLALFKKAKTGFGESILSCISSVFKTVASVKEHVFYCANIWHDYFKPRQKLLRMGA